MEERLLVSTGACIDGGPYSSSVDAAE
jgi:hypothetical protein